MTTAKTPEPKQPPAAEVADEGDEATPSKPARETGGRDGPDPTRFGDWEKNGRCIDF